MTWMRDPQNPFFAPALVNRLWDHYFGVALFEPTDELAAANPPSNPELIDWLLRDNPVPDGSVLFTGTGLVPPDDFTLEPGHTVEITVPEIGTLTNPVVPAAELTTNRRSETDD